MDGRAARRGELGVPRAWVSSAAADPYGRERDPSFIAPYLPPAPRADLRIIFQCVLQFVLVSLFLELQRGSGSLDEAGTETSPAPTALCPPLASSLSASQPQRGVPEPLAGRRVGPREGGEGRGQRRSLAKPGRGGAAIGTGRGRRQSLSLDGAGLRCDGRGVA